MRKLAKNMKVSPRTLRRSVHSDIQSNLYVRIPKNLLTPTKKVRKGRHGSTVKIFSNEKIFTADVIVNT